MSFSGLFTAGNELLNTRPNDENNIREQDKTFFSLSSQSGLISKTKPIKV